MKSFFLWFKEKLISWSSRSIRPNLKIKYMSISVKDIIELGPESTYKDKKVIKLAQVVSVSNKYVRAIDFSKPSSVLIIPIDHLYEKQELTGKILRPSEEKELYSMGAKNLWVKLTPKQYEDYKKNHNYQETELGVERQEFDRKQIEFLRKWLMSANDEKEKEPLFRFPQEPDREDPNFVIIPKMRPLSRFLKRKEEEE